MDQEGEHLRERTIRTTAELAKTIEQAGGAAEASNTRCGDRRLLAQSHA